MSDIDHFAQALLRFLSESEYYFSAISYSKTDFGKSNYITAYLSDNEEDYRYPAKIRISDHDVTNYDRMFNEIHLRFPYYKPSELFNENDFSWVISELDFRLNRSKYFRKEDVMLEYPVVMEIPEKELRITDKVISERLSSGRRGAGRKILSIKRINKEPVVNWVDIRTEKIYKTTRPNIIKKLFSDGGKLKTTFKKIPENTNLAINGQPSKLTPEQYRLVRTPEFIAWFGDWITAYQTGDYTNVSKVIDENGEPKIMWHGSDNMDNITVFKSSKGHDYNFFASDYYESARYVTQELKKRENGVMYSEYNKNKIKPFFINARKTLDAQNLTDEEASDIKTLLNEKILNAFLQHIIDIGFKNTEMYKQELDYEGMTDEEMLFEVFTRNSDNWVIIENPIIQNYIKSNGYDSFTTLEGDGGNIALYNSANIKLADGNNTTFDGGNPDIRFGGGGETKGLIKVKPNRYLYHSSNAYFRDKIKNEGFIVKGKSVTWLSDTKINGEVIFATNSYNRSDWFNSTYDDDIYEIDRSLIKNKWYQDPNFSSDKYIITFENIPPNAIKLIYEGSQEDEKYFSPSKAKKVIHPSNVDIRFGGGGSLTMKAPNLLAPNGKPSNLTPEQYQLVRTSAFKKWFGDWENSPETASKVVDENGEPLVLSRGNLVSQEELGYTFNLGKNFLKKQNGNQFGFFFTNQIDIAKKYMLVDHFDEIRGGSITNVFIQSNKTLNLLDFDLKIGQDNFVQGLIKKGVNFSNGYNYLEKKILDFNTDNYKYWGYNVFDYFDVFPELKNLFIQNGFDSVIFYEMSRTYSNYKVYVAFNSNQIKLADGTNTTFDSKNPDIRFDGGGTLTMSKPKSVYKKIIYSEEFLAWFGRWDIIAEAKTLCENVKGVYKSMFLQNTEQVLFECSVQCNSSKSEKQGAVKVFGQRICELALELYPKAKVGDKYIPKVSKVVDENDMPKMMFHGGVESFTIFNTKQDETTWRYPMIFVADNPDIAKVFARMKLYDKSGVKRRATMYKLFVNMKNPFDIFNNKKHLEKMREINDNKFIGVKDETWMYLETEDMATYIKENGFDGIYATENISDLTGDFEKRLIKNIAVFNPNQVKLSDGSNMKFDIRNPDIRYKDGGSISEENKATYRKWKKLVNMSSSELQKFLNTKEGKDAGLSKDKANNLGIHYGRESAKWILKMKDTNVSDWTPNMWKWANRQISFISRMKGNKGGLYDSKGNKTRKHTSLLVWGHNPKKKYEDGGALPTTMRKPEIESIAYHGSPILRERGVLTPSSGGELGAGLYFTRNENVAKSYSLPRGEVKNMVEAESKNGVAKLDLSNLKIKNITKDQYVNKRREFYDKEQVLNNGEWDWYVAQRAEKKLVKYYEEQGYDGLEVSDEQQGVVFINSVEKTNPDIRFDYGGALTTTMKSPKLLAHNGKPSLLTAEQYRLVRTSAFKKWFGDWENSPETASKVVDGNGEPLVVFHGSSKSFNIFKTGVFGEIYFIDYKEYSTGFGEYIYECFLNIRNPFLVKKNYNEIPKGFDGTIFKNFIKSKYEELSKKVRYAVFNPNQIKLADGTNTTFHGNNPDIRFDKGGEINKFEYTIGGL